MPSSGAGSRRKGVAGERESADLFRAAGFEVLPLQNNVRDHGDYLAAVKRVEARDLLAEWHALGRLDSGGYGGTLKQRTLDALAAGRPRLVVDSKRQERLKLPEWSRQVEAVAQAGEVPAVVYRSSREPWRVSMRLDDLLRLLA